jgi:hypothetical protein
MSYRILCIKPGYVHVVTEVEELAKAVEFIRTAWHRGDPRASYYCIVDRDDGVIAGADDLLDLRVGDRSP